MKTTMKKVVLAMLVATTMVALTGCPFDQYTEEFDTAGDFDLTMKTIVFTPNEGVEALANFYSAEASQGYAGFVDSNDLTPVVPTKQADATIELTDGAAVSFFGVDYTTVYVTTDGYVYFTADTTKDLTSHFAQAGISVLPNADDVTSEQLDNALAINFTTDAGATAQVVFWFAGEQAGQVWLSHYGVDASAGVVGLSNGVQPGPIWTGTDLSAYPAISFNTSAIEGVSWVD